MNDSANGFRIIGLIVLLFNLSIELLAGQATLSHTLKGIVQDKETGEPIPEVNVYISQTTAGGYTDKDGRFEFSTELSGIHTLVFSYVGYQTETREVNLFKELKFEFSIELVAESLELNSLEVTASNKEWEQDFKIFKRNFIGATGAALNTEIENPWVISFERDENGSLIAQAENPLSIKNYTIGYEMKVDLFEFVWPNNGDPGYYLFYARYQEMEPLSAKEQESWKKNRKNIYLGSFEHFLKCLYENTLASSEFDVVLPNTNEAVDIPEIDSQTARQLGVFSKNTQGLASDKVKAYRIRFPVDVLYGKRRWFSPERARSRIVPRGVGGVFLVTNRASLANPLSFRLDGVWSNYRLANLLPSNYQPGE